MNPEPTGDPKPSLKLLVAPVPPVVPLPPRPRVWTLMLAYVLLIGGIVGVMGGVLSLAGAVAFGLSDERAGGAQELVEFISAFIERPVVVAIGSFGNFAFELLAALVPAALSVVPLKQRLRLGPVRPGFSWGCWLATFVGVVALGEVLDSGIRLAGLWPEEGWLRVMERVMRESSPAEFALLLVPLTLGAGIGEELFCRGYLQTRLVERWGRWPGVAIAALAFGLLHFSLVHCLMAFGVGMFLGWSVERAGSIRPAMLAHVLNNLVAFGLMRLVSREGWPVWAHLTLIGACAGVFVLCVRVLRGPGTDSASEPVASAPAGT